MALSAGGLARSASIDQIRKWLDGEALPGGADLIVGTLTCTTASFTTISSIDTITLASNIQVTTLTGGSAAFTSGIICESLEATRTGAAAVIANRAGNFGAIAAQQEVSTVSAGTGLEMQLHDDGDALSTYGRIAARIVTNTAGSEDGEVAIGTASGGTVTDKVHVNEAGDILPETTEVQDLGSVALEWQDIYTQNAVTVSDQRRKRDIEDSGVGLDFLKRLRPVAFRWRDVNVPERRGPNGEVRRLARQIRHTRKHFGLLAQEVKSAMDAEGVAASDFAPYVDANVRKGVDTLGLRYGQFIPILIKALQEVDARLVALGG